MMYKTQGLLRNAWYAIGKSTEFKTNRPQKRVVMDIPLVCWRDENGVAKVLLDRCLHRNAPLSEGKVVDNCLVCPYHGWVYNEEGQCVKIPSEGPHCEKIPKISLEKFPVRECYELVWVWMGRKTPPEGEPFEMPMIAEKGWQHYYMVTEFDNNVTDLVENFMDVPHTAFVHQGWFREGKQLQMKAEVERTADSVLVSYEQPNDSISFFAKLLNPKGLPMTHTDHFYMPNIVRVDYNFGERAFVITSTCTPVSDFKTKVYTLVCYNFGWLNPVGRYFMPWYVRKILDQDVWIMEIHGENVQHFEGETTYLSSPADLMHVYIESLRNYAVNDGAGRQPAPVKKEMEFWV